MSDRRMSRREILVQGSAFAGSISFLPALGELLQSRRPYLDAALGAASWIASQAVATRGTLAWRTAPGKEPAADLYAGAAGVVPFLLECHRATRDLRFRQDAILGANYLAQQLLEQKIADPGLYTGLAGVGWALREASRATGLKTLETGYKVSRILLRGRMKQVETTEAAANTKGAVEWSDANDIIGGTSGIGLLLLHVRRDDKDAEALDLAKKAGRRLLAAARPAEGGLMWPMANKEPLNLPNFSHGTAGVSYFLAQLHAATRDRAFLDAAIEGAKYLKAVGRREGDGFLVFHREDGGRDRCYLGWCHGPAGTARLFYALARITKDPQWMELVHAGARAILASGIPEKRTEGFWNNEGMCCGTAGVGDFFLSLHGATKERAYLDMARRCADRILTAAQEEAGGRKWVHAEHRVRPDQTEAQTGMMQGAAGIGLFLLRMDGVDAGRKPLIRLPDSPWT